MYFDSYMRIFRISNTGIAFGGVRQDRNTVAQLKQDNPYDLNVPNQRRINTAIEDLSKVGGEDNVNFLLDVSENLKYGTNIDLGKKPYNDWRKKLNAAAVKSLSLSDKSVQEKLSARLDKVLNAQKEYSPDEKLIMVQRELLFEKVDQKALSEIKNTNTRNLYRNLNYFIISSEVPTSQKLYILKRLNYFMSEDYHINPQLKDKKTQALAEIVNDIVINTPESKIPNIKAINQKQHGMCGAISVSRKALAYEDKVNYVDMLISELDDTPFIQVYDRTKLGTKSKIPVPKANIDYDYALSKGYRIVDAAVMNWMNVGDTAGAFNDVIGAYTTFDKENFETFADSHIFNDISEEAVPKQDFYRSLTKAKSVIGKYIKDVEKQKYLKQSKISKLPESVHTEYEDFKVLRGILRQAVPTASEKEIRNFANTLIKLSVNSSDDKAKLNDLKKYAYISREPEDLKSEKIKLFITENSSKPVNLKVLSSNSKDILELVSEIKAQNSPLSTPAMDFRRNQKLLDAAAAYRTQQVFQLDIPEYKEALMQQFNIPDEESVIIDNLNMLSKKINNGTINPKLKEKLLDNFSNDIKQVREAVDTPASDDKILADVLDEYSVTMNAIRTNIADDMYHSLLLNNRKFHLITKLQSLQFAVQTQNDKNLVSDLASDFKVKNNKKAVADRLEKYIDILSAENCTDEQYRDIFNKTGQKSELREIYSAYKIASDAMFEQGNEAYIKGFNLINGAPADVPIEATEDMYKVLAQSFDNISFVLATLQKSLQITDENGEILNTADPKYLILKKLENMGELPTTNELRTLREHFNRYIRFRSEEGNSELKFSQLPKELTTFSKFEKNTLKKYEKNVGAWYSTVVRRHTDSFRDLKEPLEELNRDIGVKTGEYWLKEGESGLASTNSVKIYEHMTDRPYYVEKDGAAGLEHIKNSPYAAGSSTHVANTEISPHAQYVVDVKPVKIKNGDKEEIHNVILHDNTWGAIEHENVWTDDNGFTRTDYSAGYGGELGFITDDNYRNGNLAENLFEKVGKNTPADIQSKKYKKLTQDDEDFKYRMFNAFILQGVHPGAQATVSDIKLKLMLPSNELIDDLTDYAKEMTRDEIKSAMLRISTAGESARPIYRMMLEKIKGTDDIVDKGITSKEQYDKLSDSDPLKIALEKAALFRSYNKLPGYKKFSSETKSVADIEKLRASIKDDARKNFDYILAKNPDIIRYSTESSRKEIYQILKTFSDKNNLNLKVNDMIKIVTDMKKVKPKEYDGNIDNGINLIMNNFRHSVEQYSSGKISNPNEQIDDLCSQVRKTVQSKTIVTPADIKNFNDGAKLKFAQWVDREFNPKSDEEFAQILTKLRKMPKSEFEAKYGSTITNEDLNIKGISGYDIVRMIRAENLAAKRTFINIVFMQQYYKDVHTGNTTPYYELTKFGRNLAGSSYKNSKRTFDDIYMDYYYSLEALNMGRMFAKYKDEAYRKYGVLPAYPVVEISTEEKLIDAMDTIYDKINGYMASYAAYDLQMRNAAVATKLKNYIHKLPQDIELSDYQYKKVVKALKKLMKEKGDEFIYRDANKLVDDLIASGSRSVTDFVDVIDFIQDRFEAYSYTLDGKSMAESKQTCLENIEAVKSSYVRSLFEPKYQNKAFEILNKWISAKSKAVAKNSNEAFIEADAIYDRFKDLFMKHRLMLTPEKLLNEYLLLCAKDTTPKVLNMPNPDSKDAQEEYEGLRDTFKSSLESLLYKSDMREMQEILMDCADKGNLNAVRSTFKNSTLDLKDGSVVPLDSEQALSPLITPMLAEENLDTAVLFVNQLGLSEKVVDIIVKNPPFEQAYINADKIQRMLKSVDSQAKYILTELNKLSDIDSDPNYKERVEQYRQNIIRRAKNTSYSRPARTFETAINEAFDMFDKFPSMSKYFILSATMDAALQEIRSSLNHNVDVLNQPMKILQTRTNLLQKLVVPDNSYVIPSTREYFKKYGELVDYIQSQPSAFSNIGLHAE